MAKNLMPEVAKMLGVEMGERFKIEGSKVYRITQLGLVNDENFICHSKLNSLLCGDVEIIKLPFKPKEGEPYWFWRKFASDENGKTVWYLDAYDDYFEPCYTIPTINYMLGNCYRTEAECLADTAMKERIEKMERCKW